MDDLSQQLDKPIMQPTRPLPSFTNEELENEIHSLVVLQDKPRNVIVSHLDDEEDMTEESSLFYSPNQAIIYPQEQCNDTIVICSQNDAQSRVYTTNYIYANEPEERCRCGPSSIFFGCSCERLYPRSDWSFPNSTSRLSRNMSEAVVALTRCTRSTPLTDLTQPTVLELPRDINQELKVSRAKRYSKRRKVNDDALQHRDTRDSSPESIATHTRRKSTRKPPKKKLRSHQSRKKSLRKEAENLPTCSSSKRNCVSSSTNTNVPKKVWNQSAKESRNFIINQSDEKHDDNPSSITEIDKSTKNVIPTQFQFQSPIDLIPMGISDSNNVGNMSVNLASQSDTTTSFQLHTVSNLTVAGSDSTPVCEKPANNNNISDLRSNLEDENQSLPITEAQSTSTTSSIQASNEFEDHCSCRNCCRSKRCVCVRATQRCNPSCNCKDCDNPLNILEAYDVDIEDALKDDCLRSILYKVKHLELFLDRSVRIGCCQGEVRLLECIPGKKRCPHCDAQIQYSWCRGVVCVESLYPRKHCVVCNKCSIFERDIYCSCLTKAKLSNANSSRENSNSKK